MLDLPLRELLNDIKDLRKFALINSNNEIGVKLNKVLDFSESQLNNIKSLTEKKTRQKFISP